MTTSKNGRKALLALLVAPLALGLAGWGQASATTGTGTASGGSEAPTATDASASAGTSAEGAIPEAQQLLDAMLGPAHASSRRPSRSAPRCRPAR